MAGTLWMQSYYALTMDRAAAYIRVTRTAIYEHLLCVLYITQDSERFNNIPY